MRNNTTSPFSQKAVLVVAAVFTIVISKIFWGLFAPGTNVNGIIQEANAAIAFSSDGRTLCFPDIHSSGDIHSVYHYGGGERLDPDESGSPRVVDIEVQPTKKPVLLALSGYNSIAWRVKPLEGARIAGIWVSGYHEPVLLGVPEGVSVGKTYLRGKWGSEKNDCILTKRMEKLKANLDAKHEKVRFNSEDGSAGHRHFRIDYYYRLDNAYNREAFEEVASSLGDFKLVGRNTASQQGKSKSYIVSDLVASEYKKHVAQAEKDVMFYENPANMPKLETISFSAPVHQYREAQGALKKAIAEGYLKKGEREFEYYCKYKAALMRTNGGSGEYACQFHVNHKYEKAYTVLGNFNFPKEACFPQPTVIMLPPGAHKPNVRACSGDRHEVLYLRLFIKPCLQEWSKCDSIERQRSKQAYKDRKKKNNS